MRSAMVVVVVIILALILLTNSLYSVDETNQVIITKFGEYQRTVKMPGLKVKLPFVETVHRFEKRLLRYDAAPATVLTLDKKTLVVDAYARYKIADPLKFFQTVKDEAGAIGRLDGIVRSELLRELASHEQQDIISDKREALMDRVEEASSEKVLAFGIELVDVRIKRTDFPQEIAQSIYGRMQAERERVAKGFRAEGAEEYAKIKAEADKEQTVLLAEAQRQSQILKGEGDAEAIEIYAQAVAQDPEFYAFQRSLDAYKKFMTENATVVLSADSDLFRYLNSPGTAE